MKKLTLLAAILIVGTIGFAQKTNWVFDKSHSNVRFTVAHLVISEVDGKFEKFDGSVITNGESFENANINFTIDASSIDTEDGKRDEHLRSDDFFDVAKYPEISFKSKKMTKVDNKNFKLTGDFTMHGVTKEITLHAKYNGTVVDPWGNTKAGFKVTGTIDRKDWGLKYNSALDSGGMLIGEEIDITCNVQLLKK